MDDDSWNDALSGSTEIVEFIVSVYLWSPKLASSTRKIPSSRKNERRDSLKESLGPVDDKKIKEKSSWFRGYGATSRTGQWRSAACRLSEEGESCMLNVYVDETILQHSINIHLLRSTDIRFADRSLFNRRDCLAIHAKAGHRWLDKNAEDVIYLQFSSVLTLNTWFALLRSYSKPEVYGRRLNTLDGGLYRMWRQVELTVVQGRNLNFSTSKGPYSTSLVDGDSASNDLDVYCEVIIGKNVCGRTTSKKAQTCPEWHEHFQFEDLPPFEDVVLQVYRDKRGSKVQPLGSSYLNISNFRRGETLDGWFPVFAVGLPSSSPQIGELRLKLKVDEEIVLPRSAYTRMLDAFSRYNMLELLDSLEQKMKFEHLSQHIFAVAVSNDVLTKDILELADKEIDGDPRSQNTLFRGNSVLTKMMEVAMMWYGRAFLEASVGGVVRRFCAEKVCIEVDPVKNLKGPRDIEKNASALVYWCQEFWNQIYAVRNECPNELRNLFHHIRVLVEKRFNTPECKHLKWQSVSAFCFLRFLVPAILNPHMFGLHPGIPPAAIKRSLVLVAKVMQSMANLNPANQREDFMNIVRDFVKKSLPTMTEYLTYVSTIGNPAAGSQPASGSQLPEVEQRRVMQVEHALEDRSALIPTLNQESIPTLPHLVDIPRHLATISATIVRSKKSSASALPPSLEGFYQACFTVERRVFECVKLLTSLPLQGPSTMVTLNIRSLNPPVAQSETASRLASTSRSAITTQWVSRTNPLRSNSGIGGGYETNTEQDVENNLLESRTMVTASPFYQASPRNLLNVDPDMGAEGGQDPPQDPAEELVRRSKAFLRGLLMRK